MINQTSTLALRPLCGFNVLLKETPGRRLGLNEKKRVKLKKEAILIDGRMQPRVPSNLSSNFLNEKVL